MTADSKTSKTRLESSRLYKEKHADAIREWQNNYNKLIRSDKELNEKKNAADRKSRKRNYLKRKEYDKQRDPIKVKAGRMIRNRIYNGTLIRLPCEICGESKSHAHHDDYSNPLEVRWLCPAHHKEAHRAKQ